MNYFFDVRSLQDVSNHCSLRITLTITESLVGVESKMVVMDYFKICKLYSD